MRLEAMLLDPLEDYFSPLDEATLSVRGSL